MGSKCDVNLPGPVVDFKQKYLELLDTVNELREMLDIQVEKNAENRAKDLQRITALENTVFDVNQDVRALTKDGQRGVILRNYVKKNGRVTTKLVKEILREYHSETARRAMMFCSENYPGFYLGKTNEGKQFLDINMEVIK